MFDAELLPALVGELADNSVECFAGEACRDERGESDAVGGIREDLLAADGRALHQRFIITAWSVNPNNRFLMKLVLYALLVLAVFSAVTVREIKNVTTRQLLFTGTAPPSASSTSNLFFLFYGVQGVTDRSQLANYPTLVVMGK